VPTIRISDRELAECSAILAEHISEHPFTSAILLCSEDGFEVASEALEPDAMKRLAAMTSSMVALGDAIARELSLGDGQNLALECAQGRVVMQAVHTERGRVLLASIARNEMSLVDVVRAVDSTNARLLLTLS
jgi:uncharacterized protein